MDLSTKKIIKRKYADQGSDEWLNQRLNIISSTDVSIILNRNPYNNVNNLIKDKVSGTKFSNHNTKWGNYFENIAQNIYEDKFKIKVNNIGLVIHDKIKWIGASPDGICSDNSLVEFKCPVKKSIDTYPEHYWIQVQMQMEVCNIDTCNLFQCKFIEVSNIEYNKLDKNIIKGIAKIDNKSIYWRFIDYKKFKINRDKSWFNTIFPKLKTFWNDFTIYKNSSKQNHQYNTRQNKRLKIIDNYNFSDWTGIKDIYNYLNNNSIIDWLDLYGIKNGYNKNNIKYAKSNKYSRFCNYILERYKAFQISSILGDINYNNYEKTLNCLESNNNIILNATLLNKDLNFYTHVDMIIDKKKLKQIYNIDIDQKYIPCLLNGNNKIYNLYFINLIYHFGNYGVIIKEKNNVYLAELILLDNIEYINKLYEGFNFIEDLKCSGDEIDPLIDHNINLKPNINMNNGEWTESIKDISKTLCDPSLLYNLSTKERYKMYNNKVFSYKDMLIKNYKLSDIALKQIEINTSNNVEIFPKVQNNFKNWKDKKPIELFIDIESFCNRDINGKSIFVYMIGLGIVKSSKWKYVNFNTKDFTNNGEKKMFTEFVNYINNLLSNYNNDITIYHWSNVEERVIKKLLIDHNHNIDKNIIWVDLLKIFKLDKIVFRGVFGYSLKDICKYLNNNNLIESIWLTDMNGYDTLEIMNNLDMMKDIIEYNKIDVKVLKEILILLRKNKCI